MKSHVCSAAWTLSGALSLILFSIVFPPHAWGQDVGFDSERWALQGARTVEHLGRTSLMGTAYLKDVDFQDGMIEVDIAADGRTSYPGFVFRMQSPEECERFYIRPHRLEAYGDVLQYTPVFNGNAGWQLYSGPGYTAGAAFPRDQWVHVKLVVGGTQAAVFLGESPGPALVINRLERGIGAGTIGVMGPGDGSAYFSNFSYSIGDPPGLPLQAVFSTPPGVIADWKLSPTFKMPEIDLEATPESQGLSGLEWLDVTADASGLVDVSRYYKRVGQTPDCVFARASLVSDRAEVKQIRFGYSDLVSIFLNGQIVFSASNAYRYRDPSATGVVGAYDSIYLPLRKGENDLTLVLAEGFGGWGFIVMYGDATYQAETINKVWETPDRFKVPESVAYDPAKRLLYVSNYDIYNPSGGQGRQFISRVGLDGSILDLEWAGGLNNPTGLALYGDRLFAVDRAGVVEIDTDTGAVVERFPAPQPRLLNDIAIDPAGVIYVSDSDRGVILRLAGGRFEEWLSGDGIEDPNGLVIHGGNLVFGNNGDVTLRAADLATGEVKILARFASGIIDGIQVDSNGDYLVSHVQGRLYRVSARGDVTELLDTSVTGVNCADFEYIPGAGMIVIPTFVGNGVKAYRLAG